MTISPAQITKAFQIRDVIEQGDKVAMFGSFTYRRREPGKEITSPFSILAKVKDGKIQGVPSFRRLPGALEARFPMRRGDKGMSYSISTLLIRSLNDVFGENDPARRRAAIDEIFNEDCVFHEPRGVYRGRDEIDRVAGAIKATHPDFRYQPIAPPEELGNGGRVRCVSGRPGEAPAYAGTDFIIARDGRIAAVYLFFDQLP